MSKIQTTIETITPKRAEEYLQSNPCNRPKKVSHIANLARKMRNGTFMLTHQGIAFNAKNELIDGQNRLEAIRLAKTPVKMMVTRNLPDEFKNGVTLYAMDALDCGSPRSMGDIIVLKHGVDPSYGNLVAAVIRMIALFISKSHQQKTGADDAANILKYYSKDIDAVLLLCPPSGSRIRTSAVLAGMVLFHAIDPEAVESFAPPFFSGEDLKVGRPAHTLREYINRSFKTGFMSTSQRRHVSSLTLTALYRHANGEQWVRPYPNDKAIAEILAKQGKRVEYLAEMLFTDDRKTVKPNLVAA